MSTFVFALLLLTCAAFYFMNAEERAQVAQRALKALKDAIHAAREASNATDPFDEMLRARTGRLVVTPLLVGLNVLIFMRMLVGSGSFDDVPTLVAWGGNFAPRTTNGEWWRLAASMFVHGGLFHLLFAMAALVSLGVILERAVGRIAFAIIYLTSGVVASVVSLWTTSPTSVSYGSSGAVFGIYGLLLASVAWAIVKRPPVGVPLVTVKRLAVAAGPFLLYNLVAESLGTTSEMAGLGVGFVGGLVVARGVGQEKPGVRRAAWLAAATAVAVVLAADPMQGTIDFRPEVARIAAVEEKTAGAYDDAVANYRVGRIRAKELVQLIDRTIIPELQTVRTRVVALRGIPREQAPMMTAAQEYFELREASWRRRAEGLLKSNTTILRDAEVRERAALDAFRKMRPST